MTAAALVRVPRAWGDGGEAMCEAAMMDVGVPESATVAMSTLDEQVTAVAAALPEIPVVLGGCCCAHIGAAAGLAARHGRISVVWLDAHGDLNTPQSSPSGNEWGMPFRRILDDGHAAAEDCALIGARQLDPPEVEFIAEAGLATSSSAIASVVSGCAGAYVAFDCDVVDAHDINCFMPEPGGPTLEECLSTVRQVAALTPVLGIGLTGLVASEENPGRLRRIIGAALPARAFDR
jgi:arginase